MNWSIELKVLVRLMPLACTASCTSVQVHVTATGLDHHRSAQEEGEPMTDLGGTVHELFCLVPGCCGRYEHSRNDGSNSSDDIDEY